MKLSKRHKQEEVCLALEFLKQTMTMSKECTTSINCKEISSRGGNGLAYPSTRCRAITRP